MDKTKFATAKVRISFSEIWEAKDKLNNGKEMYSACLIIRKDDAVTVNAFKEGIAQLEAVAKAQNGGKLPAIWKNPLRDADLDPNKKDSDVFKGCYFVNASTKLQPRIVDRSRNPLHDPLSIVSGDYVRFFINLYGFNVPGNAGVGVGFSSVQFIEKGQALGGGSQFDDAYDEQSDFDDLENLVGK